MLQLSITFVKIENRKICLFSQIFSLANPFVGTPLPGCPPRRGMILRTPEDGCPYVSLVIPMGTAEK